MLLVLSCHLLSLYLPSKFNLFIPLSPSFPEIRFPIKYAGPELILFLFCLLILSVHIPTLFITRAYVPYKQWCAKLQLSVTKLLN